MDDIVNKSGSAEQQSEDVMGIGKGSWIAEEDTIPVNYITTHGEGRWNPIARTESLNITGESCKLRWLNYLRPDVNRGNITLQEQMFILQLYCRWGNRWSKIAQYLPGRTKNEIKNYWRTRVTKQTKQLKCSVNSEQFRYTLRYVWIPRLLGRIQVASQSRFPNWTQVEHSGWSLNAERLPERTYNKTENHRHSNVKEQLAGKEKAFEFNGRPDNNSKCLWPLFTETSDDEDEDRRSESKSHEYSGPS